MPKLSHFRKMLRLQAKADKHKFRNAPSNHRTDDSDWWRYEGFGEAIAIAHKTGGKVMRSKFPKGGLK